MFHIEWENCYEYKIHMVKRCKRNDTCWNFQKNFQCEI